MKVDEVVTLANGKNYLLLLNSELTDENYFLSVLLDSNNEPTDEYVVLKEIEKEGETYCQKVDDPLILNELISDYKIQYNDEYEN